jgi:hypothetical protein
MGLQPCFRLQGQEKYLTSGVVNSVLISVMTLLIIHTIYIAVKRRSKLLIILSPETVHKQTRKYTKPYTSPPLLGAISSPFTRKADKKQSVLFINSFMPVPL